VAAGDRHHPWAYWLRGFTNRPRPPGPQSLRDGCDAGAGGRADVAGERAGRMRRDLLPQPARFGRHRLAQALSIVPGTSRSASPSRPASTAISTAHRRRGSPSCLSTPAIAAAAVWRSTTCTSTAAWRHSECAVFVGVAVSAIVGCAAIGWFLHYLRGSSLRPFGVLSHYFWHNSNCSGFHPPASVMKLLSPTSTEGSTK